MNTYSQAVEAAVKLAKQTKIDHFVMIDRDSHLASTISWRVYRTNEAPLLFDAKEPFGIAFGGTGEVHHSPQR